MDGGRNLNGLALCAGIGGIELGLEVALPEYRCVCHVEREAYPAALLVSRMEEGTLDEAPIWDDLETFDGRPWRGVVDIISAGFPCQPWSTAGDQKGTDDARWLWPAIARIIRHIRPRYVFLENVPGLLSGGLDPILSDLAILGYDVEWDMFSAAAVGASHYRRRLFILAHANGSGFQEDQRDVSPGKSHSRRRIEDASYTDGNGCNGQDLYIRRRRQRKTEIGPSWDPPDVPNTNSKRLPLPGAIGSDQALPMPRAPGQGWEWWKAEPDVDRVVHGIPSRVDRIRALGNAVVPGVAAIAFKILESRFR